MIGSQGVKSRIPVKCQGGRPGPNQRVAQAQIEGGGR